MLLSRGNMRSRARFTRGDLRRRKWLFMPFVRMIIPVPVILNRRSVPLWVFIFGIGADSFPNTERHITRHTAPAQGASERLPRRPTPGYGASGYSFRAASRRNALPAIACADGLSHAGDGGETTFDISATDRRR